MKKNTSEIALILYIIICLFNLFAAENLNTDMLLTVYDYSINTSHYNVSLIHSDNGSQKLNASLYCKLAAIIIPDKIRKVESLGQLFNKNWLFYTEKPEIVKYIIDRTEDISIYINVQGIIVPEDILEKIQNYFSKQIPIIAINSSYKEEMKKLDYEDRGKNTFVVLTNYKEFISYPLTYFIIISSLAFVILFGFAFIWAFKYKITDAAHIMTLQKIILFYPVADALLNGTILLNVLLVKGKSDSNNGYNVYIETALVTINAVFRTILWFIIVLIISGWQITKQQLSRPEMKFYIKVYVFIYIAMCIDQIIDSVFGKLLVFSPSEIKNIIYYGVIVVILTLKGKKSLKYLKQKLVYASLLSREYIPALKLKIRMIYYTVAMVITYVSLFVICISTHKIFFSSYDSDDFRLINYHFLDLLLLITLMSIYFPRKLPEYFKVDFGDDNAEITGELYLATLPSIEKLKSNTVKIFNDKELKSIYKKNPTYPLVIINPFSSNPNEPVVSSIEDKKEYKNAFINSAIEHINVGFIEQ